MTDAEELIGQLILTEPCLASITPERLDTALNGFPLPLHESIEWLTRATQGALFVSLTPADEGIERQSNKDTREELERLSRVSRNAWSALFKLSPEAERAALHHLLASKDELGGRGEIARVLSGLEWLADTLQGAAGGVENQHKWRAAIARKEHIRRAQCLSPVFERAFSAMPTVNTRNIEDRPKGQAASYGPWPDFYQRVVGLAFGEHGTADLEGVLDEARRLHIRGRVKFGSGVIPE